MEKLEFTLTPVYGRGLFTGKQVKVTLDQIRRYPDLILYDEQGREI